MLAHIACMGTLDIELSVLRGGEGGKGGEPEAGISRARIAPPKLAKRIGARWRCMPLS
jgi:hypothetical protein